MTVRRRLMLLVMLLISLSVLSAAVLFAGISWRGMAAQARQDGELLARLLAQTVSVAQQAPMTVDEIAGQGMSGQAALVAQLVQTARRFSMPAEDLDRSLRAVAAAAELGEVWVTDRDGRPLFSSLDDIDARLGNDDPLLQSKLFAGLRDGQEARCGWIATRKPAKRAAWRRWRKKPPASAKPAPASACLACCRWWRRAAALTRYG